MIVASIVDAALFNSAIRAVAPVLLAALGGLICQRAGVFNVGLEGMMLVGAFAAVTGSYFTGSAIGGIAFAVVAGVGVSMILAVGSVTLGADPIVLGVAINLLALGLTSFLLQQVYNIRGTFQDPAIVGLSPVKLGLIGDMPLIGDVLTGHSILVYVSFGLAGLIWFILYRLPIGLRLRGVGESAKAASTLGVNVSAYHYGVVLGSGVLCGLAGAQLSLGNVTLFAENMSSGRGWIAVVAVLLAAGRPGGVVAACLLFGVADAIGFRLQGDGLPSQITEAAPFVITLVALVVASRRRSIVELRGA